MTLILTQDLTLSEGEVRTYAQTSGFIFATAVMVGWYEGRVGETYFEPTVINYGEMHLGTTAAGAVDFFRFAGSLSWNYGVFRNYGLISAVAPDDFDVRALFAPSRSPPIYNGGRIVAKAQVMAIGYEGWDPAVVLTNAVSGYILAQSGERSLAVYLPNGGTIVNEGRLLAHSLGDAGHDLVPNHAFAVSLGGRSHARSSLTNSGLIEATDSDPATDFSVAVMCYDMGPINIVNSGTLRGDYAIKVHSETGNLSFDNVTVENSGLIEGDVLLGFGKDLLRNTNRIIGDVDLGRNDDVYDGELGTVTGTVRGGEGNDQLRGGAGADVLDGGHGTDRLSGGSGNDQLAGGTGGDVLDGGAGADFFVFTHSSDSIFVRRSDGYKVLPDVIEGFVSGEDRIDLSAIDAVASSAGDDPFTLIGTGAFTGRAGELRVEMRDGYAFISGDVDGDSVADLLIIVQTPVMQPGDVIL